MMTLSAIERNQFRREIFAQCEYPLTHLLMAILSTDQGEIWVNQKGNPQTFVAQIGKYAGFVYLIGQVDPQMFEKFTRQDMIMVPMNHAWSEFLRQQCDGCLEKFYRYMMQAPDHFDRRWLEELRGRLPEPYQLCPISIEIFQQCLDQSWSVDLVGNFESYEDFVKEGLGFVITYRDRVVSGASTFAPIENGIEIELDTHPEFRGRGLAKSVVSQLILSCINKNIQPSWDAHNEISRRIAESLGYTTEFTYEAFETI